MRHEIIFENGDIITNIDVTKLENALYNEIICAEMFHQEQINMRDRTKCTIMKSQMWLWFFSMLYNYLNS